MKSDMNNSNTSSLDDATAMQLFMANAIAANNTAQQEKEKLNEMILDATSSKTQAVPVDHANIENVIKTRDKLVALRSNASVEAAPVLDKAIQLVNAHLADPKSITPTKTKSSEPSVRSRQKQMSVALATQSEMLVKKSSAPAFAATSNSGSSLGALPAPVLPPSNCPPLSPDGSGSDWDLTDANGQAFTFINYLGNNPTDPTAQMELMNFLASASPAQVTQMTQWLDTSNFKLTGDNGLIAVWAATMAKYAFFTGYNGTNGQLGMTNFLNDIQNQLGNSGNQFSSAMQTYLSHFQYSTGIYAGNGANEFVANHTGVPGDLIWSVGAAGLDSNGYIFHWNSQGANSLTDQDMIESLINGDVDSSGKANTWFSSIDLKAMNRQYRLSALDQIVKEFGGDNLMYAISLWLATDFGTENGAQIEGQNVQIGLLTQGSPFGDDLTNTISTFSTYNGAPSLNGSGGGTDQDADTFVRALYAQQAFINAHPELASMSSQFNTGVFNQIMNLNVTYTFPDPNPTAPAGTMVTTTATLGTLTQAYLQYGSLAIVGNFGGVTMAQALNLAFGSAAPASGALPVNTPGTFTPNPNTQVAESAATQDSALYSGLSKSASTTLSTLTSYDKTIEQFAEKIISMQKTNEKYIANYITN